MPKFNLKNKELVNELIDFINQSPLDSFVGIIDANKMECILAPCDTVITSQSIYDLPLNVSKQGEDLDLSEWSTMYQNLNNSNRLPVIDTGEQSLKTSEEIFRAAASRPVNSWISIGAQFYEDEHNGLLEFSYLPFNLEDEQQSILVTEDKAYADQCLTLQLAINEAMAKRHNQPVKNVMTTPEAHSALAEIKIPAVEAVTIHQEVKIAQPIEPVSVSYASLLSTLRNDNHAEYAETLEALFGVKPNTVTSDDENVIAEFDFSENLSKLLTQKGLTGERIEQKDMGNQSFKDAGGPVIDNFPVIECLHVRIPKTKFAEFNQENKLHLNQLCEKFSAYKVNLDEKANPGTPRKEALIQVETLISHSSMASIGYSYQSVNRGLNNLRNEFSQAASCLTKVGLFHHNNSGQLLVEDVNAILTPKI